MEGGGTVTTVDGGATIQMCMTGPKTDACQRLACKPVVCCLNKAAIGVVLVRKKIFKKGEMNDKGLPPAEAGSGPNPVKAIVTDSRLGMVTWVRTRRGAPQFCARAAEYITEKGTWC